MQRAKEVINPKPPAFGGAMRQGVPAMENWAYD